MQRKCPLIRGFFKSISKPDPYRYNLKEEMQMFFIFEKIILLIIQVMQSKMKC